jgi:hypothetical protein
MWREAPIVEEVGVMSEDDAVVSPGSGKHILIRMPFKPEFSDVRSIPAVLAKNLGYIHAQTLINQKASLLAKPLRIDIDFFLRGLWNSTPWHGYVA